MRAGWSAREIMSTGNRGVDDKKVWQELQWDCSPSSDHSNTERERDSGYARERNDVCIGNRIAQAANDDWYCSGARK